jgi:hypothetical protein
LLSNIAWPYRTVGKQPYLYLASCQRIAEKAGKELFMSEDRFIDALKRQKSSEALSEELSIIISKMRSGKKLTASEFQTVYELLHVDGPRIKYQNANVAIRDIHQTSNNLSNLQNF